MFKCINLMLACAALLVFCNQTRAQDPKSDVETLKADLAKTKSELEAMGKELAKAKADIAALMLEVMGAPLNLPPVDVQTEVLKRWNAVAADMTFDVPVVNKANFRWTGFTNFPHPTFKGGSGEAYGALAKVLVAFLQKGDNFEFLTKNGLFTTDLLTGSPKTGIRSSFAGWAKQFSNPMTSAKFDDNTRKAIKELSERIETAVKNQDAPKK